MKGGKRYTMPTNGKKVGMAKSISDKADFRAKNTMRHKGHFLLKQKNAHFIKGHNDSSCLGT